MNRISRNALWNIFGNGFPLILGFLTIPYLLEELGLERFGLLTLLWVLLGYFSVLDLGVSRATTRYVAAYAVKGQRLKVRRIVVVAIAFLLVIGTVLGAGIVLLSPLAPGMVSFSDQTLAEEIASTAIVIGLILPVVLATSGLRGVLEGQERFRLTNLIKVPASLSTFLVPLVILPFSHRLEDITAGLALSRFVFFVVYGWYAITSLRPDSSKERLSLKRLAVPYLGRLVGYGSWIFLSSSVGMLMSMAYLDRFLIANLTSVADLAYYATPFEIILRVLIVPAAIVAALFPVFSAYSAVGSPIRPLYQKGVTYINLIALPMVFATCALAPDLLGFWIDDEFAANSSFILQVLMVGLFFSSIAHVPYTVLQATGRPAFTAVRHIIELPFHIVLIVWLITAFGVKGAAVGWAIWALVDLVLLTLFMKFRVDKTIGLGLSATAVVAALLFISTGFLVSSIGSIWIKLAAVVFGLLAFSLFAWRSLDQGERQTIAGIFGIGGLVFEKNDSSGRVNDTRSQ